MKKQAKPTANKKKSHARAPGVAQLTIAIDKILLDQTGTVASMEHRSRNQQIAAWVEEGLKKYIRNNPEEVKVQRIKEELIKANDHKPVNKSSRKKAAQ